MTVVSVYVVTAGQVACPSALTVKPTAAFGTITTNGNILEKAEIRGLPASRAALAAVNCPSSPAQSMNDEPVMPTNFGGTAGTVCTPVMIHMLVVRTPVIGSPVTRVVGSVCWMRQLLPTSGPIASAIVADNRIKLKMASKHFKTHLLCVQDALL